jgi:hypothetical protein
MKRLHVLSILLSAALPAAGCSSGPDGDNVLTGTVTRNGQPVKNVTVTVGVKDGPEANAVTGDDGEYRIPNPPKGALQVRVTALTPPPPPGTKAPPPPPGSITIPPRYTKADNGLSVEYTGGKQTYDIDLKP